MIRLLALAGLLYLTYAAWYVDASGARCAAFSIGNHEVDMCYGRIDR